MGSFITKDEIVALMRQVNGKILRKGEMDALNFEGFVKYINQLAIYIFTKAPMSQVNYNYVDCLEKFFSMVFITAKEKGEHRLMLDDKDAYPNTEELAKLNIDIQDNPNMRLPEGYKKILESTMDYVYRVPGNGIDPNYKMAYEILDDMIMEQFGFHVMEKKMLFNSFFKVVPQQKVEVQLPKGAKMRDDRSPADQRGRTQGNLTKSNEPRAAPQEYNSYQSTDKYKTKFINKVVEERIKKEEEDKQKEAEAERRRIKRQKEVQDQLRDQSENARLAKQMKEDEERKQQLDKIEKEKERELSRRRELEKKKELVKQYREKRQQEVMIKEEEDKETKYKEYQSMRKEREDFIKKQKMSLVSVIFNFKSLA